MKYKIGINLTSIENSLKTKEALKLIKEVGFDSIMLHEKQGELEENIKAALELGLNIPFVHLAYKTPNALWVEGESNNLHVENVINTIKICGKYGIKIAVMHLTSGNSDCKTIKPNKQGISSLKKILEVAKENNVKIAAENLDKLNVRHLLYSLKKIKSNYFGFCYDSGHHCLYNKKIDFLKKFGNRVFAVHLHNNNINWKYGTDWCCDAHFLPLDGKIDFNKVMQKLAKSSYENVILLEVYQGGGAKTRTLYNDLTPKEFLQKAFEQGKILSKQLEDLRN